MKTNCSLKVAGIGILQLIAAQLINSHLVSCWLGGDPEHFSSIVRSFKRFRFCFWFSCIWTILVLFLVAFDRHWISEQVEPEETLILKILYLGSCVVSYTLTAALFVDGVNHLMLLAKKLRSLHQVIINTSICCSSYKGHGIFKTINLSQTDLAEFLYSILVDYASEIRRSENNKDDISENQSKRSALIQRRASFHDELHPLIMSFLPGYIKSTFRWKKPYLFQIAKLVVDNHDSYKSDKSIWDIVRASYNTEIPVG